MTDQIDTAAERAKLAALAGFTPGPWEEVTPADGLWPPRVFRGPEIICMVDNSDYSQFRRIRNARLIAAAPDLLATVHRLLDALDAERARVKKANAERDEYEAEGIEINRRLNDALNSLQVWQARAEKAEAEQEVLRKEVASYHDAYEQAKEGRDQALARLAVVQAEMRERCAEWHDEVVAHDQGGIDYSDLVGIPISNRYELQQSVKAHEYSAREIRSLPLDSDAEAALQRVVDARMGLALEACQIIDDAVREGHNNTSDLIIHLLTAVEPARAALKRPEASHD